LADIWSGALEGLDAADSLPEALRDRKKAGRNASVHTQTLPGGLERLVAAVSVSEVARGYLSLLGIAGEMDELDHMVVEQGVRICALEMARLKALRENEKRLRGDLLSALLQDTLSPRDAHLWLENLSYDPDQPYLAIRFAWEGTNPPSRRRLETLVNGELARLDLNAVASPLGAEMICFLPASGSGRPEHAIAFCIGVQSQGAQEQPRHTVRCGIGAVALDLGAWRTSFRQAGQALELARRLGEPSPLYFPDLSVYRLLLPMEHSPDLSSFVDETLGPLFAHESSAEFIRTLEAFFEHHGNLSQTAEALYLHRNTLAYRLDRIEEILNIDLDSAEARLSVQLALHIQRMSGGRGVE
jgi:purine catabolism regulator